MKNTDGNRAIACMSNMVNLAPGADVCARSGDGNCQRDVDPGYDGAACACVPCPNVKLCGRWMPPFFLQCNDGYCFGCAITWGGGLEFVPMTGECSVCLGGVSEGVIHPSRCPGKHVFCVSCTRQMYWGPDSDMHENDSGWVPLQTCPLCRW